MVSAELQPLLKGSSPGIRIIDSGFVREDFAAAYLLTTSDGAVFVDTNTTRAVPRLIEAMQEAGVRPEDVRYVIVTHVHLDHAGGAGALMQHCPNARLLAHPRALRHLVDPARLEASARKVYGDALFDKLYGGIPPVPAERAQAMDDGAELVLGEAHFRFLHTRGHANHHFCIQELASKVIFTGDTFGLRYPELGAPQLFVMPTTSPTDFDPEAAVESIRRIAACGARRALLTHYGVVDDLSGAAAQLEPQIRFSEILLGEAIEELRHGHDAHELEASLRQRLRVEAGARLREAGIEDAAQREHALDEILAMDLDLNSAGIVAAAQKAISPPRAG